MEPDITNMDESGIMDGARLEPEKIVFPGKDKLRKTASDLTDAQIEYLSVACLENDLSPEQLQELESDIRVSDKNRIVFDTIQKTKLVPPPVVYEHKSSLKKLIAGKRTFRIISIGLSAAATIGILILSYIFVPDFVTRRNNQYATGIIMDTVPVTFFINGNKPIIARAEIPVSKKEIVLTETESNIKPNVVAESLPITEIIADHTLAAASVPTIPGISFPIPELMLITSNNSFIAITSDYERSRLRRFIASTFREKILREKYYTDEPLKPIEIAMAGVEGINKLLDWNMQLKETLGEKGEVKSVYFSSALLTFNAPVKKTGE